MGIVITVVMKSKYKNPLRSTLNTSY